MKITHAVDGRLFCSCFGVPRHFTSGHNVQKYGVFAVKPHRVRCSFVDEAVLLLVPTKALVSELILGTCPLPHFVPCTFSK